MSSKSFKGHPSSKVTPKEMACTTFYTCSMLMVCLSVIVLMGWCHYHFNLQRLPEVKGNNAKEQAIMTVVTMCLSFTLSNQGDERPISFWSSKVVVSFNRRIWLPTDENRENDMSERVELKSSPTCRVHTKCFSTDASDSVLSHLAGVLLSWLWSDIVTSVSSIRGDEWVWLLVLECLATGVSLSCKDAWQLFLHSNTGGAFSIAHILCFASQSVRRLIRLMVAQDYH